jgi:hypothetical protein
MTRPPFARAPVPEIPAMCRRLLLALVLFLGIVPSAHAVPALPAERTSSSQAGWSWLYNVSGATLSAYLTALPTLRLADLRVHTAGATTTFDAAFIQNAGDDGVSGWWWQYDVTSTQISSALTANHARLLTLDRYLIAGQTRYCCVMVNNTNSEARSWWWVLDQTATQLGNFANTNHARIITLRSHDAGFGARLYDAVLLSNTGSDALGWYYFMGISAASLSSTIQANNLRIVDLDAYLSGVDPLFDVVLIPNTGAQNARWYWWYNAATTTLGQTAANYGSRIMLHQSYGSGLSASVMISDIDPATERIGNELKWADDGISGCYFKQVSGPAIMGFNSQFVFEPASAIKPLAATHFMRRIDAHTESMSAAATYFTALSGSCPVDLVPVATTDRQLLWLMLKWSDNSATQWFRARYGNAALNATATTLGMTSTQWNHRIGCADSVLATPNRLTLSDIDLLYEKLQLAQSCSANARDTLHTYLENESDDTGFRTLIFQVVDEEAAKLGLSGTIATEYKAALRFHFKQGGYGLSNGGPAFFDRSAAGWVGLPTCASGFQARADYVFGAFVQAAAGDTSAANRGYRACSEMMRDAIHATLGGCPLAVASPGLLTGLELAAPAPNPARAGSVLRWSLPIAARVQVALLDVGGREIARLLEGIQSPGTHEVRWSGRDAAGRKVAAGTYFVRLRAGAEQRVTRLTLLQ